MMHFATDTVVGFDFIFSNADSLKLSNKFNMQTVRQVTFDPLDCIKNTYFQQASFKLNRICWSAISH